MFKGNIYPLVQDTLVSAVEQTHREAVSQYHRYTKPPLRVAASLFLYLLAVSAMWRGL